jgi:septum formation protein
LSAKRRIVLASSSPRRKELLSRIGLEFSVVPADYDESAMTGPPAEMARLLSLGKAEAVAAVESDAIVIGADTIVVVDDVVLGKPVDEADARRMLRIINGRTHVVITGVAVIDSSTHRTLVEHEESSVHIRRLSDDEIYAYVRTGEPSDKAGAYAVQGIGSLIVDRIEGDYFNVVGLPMARLALMLAQFGVRVL